MSDVSMIAETKEKKYIMEKKRMLDSACSYKRLTDVLKKKMNITGENILASGFIVKQRVLVIKSGMCSNFLPCIAHKKGLKLCLCEHRWVMLSNQQLYTGLPTAPLPSFRLVESWRCHWTLKMIPLMLYSCMFSATADPVYRCTGRTVKGPQMGMNRCHFNYVSSRWSPAESARRRRLF